MFQSHEGHMQECRIRWEIAAHTGVVFFKIRTLGYIKTKLPALLPRLRAVGIFATFPGKLSQRHGLNLLRWKASCYRPKA